jgi:hypothetical protein
MGHLGGVFGASRLVPPKTNPGCTDFHQLCTDPSQRQTTREIQLHLRVILRIGRDHEGPRLDRQQVVCPHEPHHPFVVHQQAAPPEFRCEAPVAIPAPVGDGRSPQWPSAHPCLLPWAGVLATTGRIPPGSPAPDDPSVRSSIRLASTSRPGCERRCLRASLSAPLASRLDSVHGPFLKSTSKTFSANTRLSRLTYFRRVVSREFAGGSSLRSTSSSVSRQVYNSRRLMPGSFSSATILSHCVAGPWPSVERPWENFPRVSLPPTTAPCAKYAIRRVSI